MDGWTDEHGDSPRRSRPESSDASDALRCDRVWRRWRSRPARSAPARPGRTCAGSGWARGAPRASAQLSLAGGRRPILIAGFCGALDPALEPGDIVLASELRGPTGTIACDDPTILAGVLRRGGLRVHDRADRLEPATRDRRAPARALPQPAPPRSTWSRRGWRRPPPRAPLVTLRVVLDTRSHELHRPLRDRRPARRPPTARCAGPARWSRSGPRRSASREVVLASPRASCAGVERAVEIVERALEDRGAPIYVRKQIVHNAHVVRRAARSAGRCSSTSSTRCRRARP